MRKRCLLLSALLTVALVLPDRAGAQEEGVEEKLSDSDRVHALEERLTDLEQRLKQSDELKIRPRNWVNVNGYVDLGFFAPNGNGGVGYVQDYGNAVLPRYAGKYGWVFLGDLLATPVNSRGEAADLGQNPGVNRFDSIHSRGAPGFIANEINLLITSALLDNLILSSSLNFTPRSGREFSLGDYFDADIAQMEWMPTRDQKTSIFVGKMDSVLGIEYRERKSNQRFGITPSLVARYTTGNPIGIKVRSKLLKDDMLVLAAALTNGSNGTEQFHFYNEIATHAGKTLSGRISLKPPLIPGLEMGLSGEYGAQDNVLSSAIPLWFWGIDAQYHVGNLALKAQWLRGMGEGSAADGVYGLHLNGGGYLEANQMLTPLFGVLARVEYRNAFVWLADERAYVTQLWRATAGVHAAFTDNIVLKAEYLHNQEFHGLPRFTDDIFTSSLVLSY